MTRDPDSDINETRCGTCGSELEWHVVNYDGHIAIALMCTVHGQVAILDPLA